MQQQISDLLDCLVEADVDLTPEVIASEQRILELTREKAGIHQQKRRGLSWVGRALIAAAVLTAMAIPVLAVTGFSFSDWLEGLGERPAVLSEGSGPIISDEGELDTDQWLNVTMKQDYDNSIQIGSISKNWSAAGWILEISGKDATEEGLTFSCKVTGIPEIPGSCSFSGGWWLEKWDGTGYVATGMSQEDDSVTALAQGTTATQQIRFPQALESGAYRIAKAFTHTNEAGSESHYTFYAKFRLFGPEMGQYVRRVQDAIDELNSQEVLHLITTEYNYGTLLDWRTFTTEIWKLGDDWLVERQYLLEDGRLYGHSYYLCRDGRYYCYRPVEDGWPATAAYWKEIDLNYAAEWHQVYLPRESTIGQVDGDQGMIQILEYNGYGVGTLETNPLVNHRYKQGTYLFDDAGKLTGISASRLTEPGIEGMPVRTMELLQASREEISQKIAAIAISPRLTFSWTEDLAALIGKPGVQDKGFRSQGTPVYTESDARAVALQELNYPNHHDYTVYRDDGNAIWKVCFQTDRETITVYVDDWGMVRIIVTE